MVGQTALDDQILNTLGLTGFKSGGLGAVVQHDSRDNDNSPTKGWVLNFNNIAYREWLGGEQDFEVYRMEFKGYWEHGHGNVLAVRQNNQWTVDAPPSAYAPITLSGYKMGQYLGKYMSSIEVEERVPIAQRWSASAFAGVACLYGGGEMRRRSEPVSQRGGGHSVHPQAEGRHRGEPGIRSGKSGQLRDVAEAGMGLLNSCPI